MVEARIHGVTHVTVMLCAREAALATDKQRHSECKHATKRFAYQGAERITLIPVQHKREAA